MQKKSKLEIAEEGLKKLDELDKLDKADEDRIYRLLGTISQIQVAKGEKLDKIKKGIDRWKKSPISVEEDIKNLMIEYNTRMEEPRIWHKIIDELNEKSTEVDIVTAKSIVEKLSPKARKLAADLAAMRVYPKYLEKPTRDVKFTSPILQKGKMSKPSKNPLYALDSFLLDRVGEHIGKALYIIPAFSAEYEFANHGHVLAINLGGKYTPRESPRIVHIKKRAEELNESEINEVMKKTGNDKKVLIIKGINDILNKEQMKKLIEKVNPEYIAIYGTYHGRYPNLEGVPKIDAETKSVVHEFGFEDITDKVFKKDELKKVEELERKIKERFHPWAEYFPATRVRVYRRKVK